MTDATTHNHRHGHGGDSPALTHADAQGAPLPAADRTSLIEASAAARALVVSVLLLALWGGVYWAIH